MSENLSNSTAVNPFQGNMDFAALRSFAIDFLQKHNPTLWTDYNYHDPGVTILEQFCFAFTDLAYRTDLPIEDILQKGGNNPINDSIFPYSDKILNTFPVVPNDIRKIILDSLIYKEENHSEHISDYIYNAWIDQVHTNIYSVTIQLNTAKNKEIFPEDIHGNEEAKAEIQKKVRHSLGAFRGLCTDFTDIHILKKKEINITGNINIKNGYITEKVLADIYTQVDAYLNPNVPFYTFSELAEKGIPNEKIFEGPALTRGFILEDDLKSRKLEIDVSEVRWVIANINGVSGINNIRVNNEEYICVIPQDCFPLLTKDLYYLQENKGLKISKNGATVDIGKLDKRVYNTYLSELNSKRTKPSATATPKVNIAGTYRDLEEYYSIQKYFPQCYGIGDYGLQDKVFVNEPEYDNQNALNTRLAQAHQLKAYLMLFEQILADYLSQLANVGDLFSTNYLQTGNHAKTYFYQLLDNKVPGTIDIIGVSDDKKTYSESLAENSESDKTYVSRKEMFLDHLLARINEKLDSYPYLLFEKVYGKNVPANVRESKVLKSKSEFLKMYAQISYDRNKTLNYFSDIIDTENISGLEKRILLLLGIKNLKKRKLHEIGKIHYIKAGKGSENQSKAAEGNYLNDEIDIFMDIEITEKFADTEIVIGYDKIEEIKIKPDETEHNHKGFHFNDVTGAVINDIFRDGMDKYNYRIGHHKNRKDGEVFFVTFFRVPHEGGKAQWLKIHINKDRETAITKLNGLISTLTETNKNSEGFHFIEHVLLKQQGHEDDKNSDNTHDAKKKKSETNAITIVLPLWPARFQDSGFQDYVQQLFIKHAPAYLYLNFIWLDLINMKQFEDVYFPWLSSLKYHNSDHKNELSRKLISLLNDYS